MFFFSAISAKPRVVPRPLNPTGANRIKHNRYAAVHLLGSGSNAAVMKVERAGQRHWSPSMEMIINEGEIMEAITQSHPHIVELVERGELKDGRSYLATWYVEGSLLYDRIFSPGNDSKLLTLQQSLWVVFCLAWALGHIHEHGIVHADLKPDNVFLGPIAPGQEIGFTVKLGDFSAARKTGTWQELEDHGRRPYYTQGYFNVVRRRNMPPDQQEDFYNLGLVLYEMLTGNKAQTFDIKDVIDVPSRWEAMERECDALPGKITALDQPDEIKTLLNRLTQSNDAEPFADASEILDDILALPPSMRT